MLTNYLLAGHFQTACLKTFMLVMVTGYIFIGVAKPAMADDYHDGMTAYFAEDFSLAQKYWLKAADGKDARSMFNLGLLHEQKKMHNSSIEKALTWYRLAAENGYPAGGYHLAQRMLERGGTDDDAIVLIRRAADQGYAPARRYLGLGRIDSSSKAVTYNDQAAETSIAADNIYQTENWINQRRSQDWTIQLLAFKQKEQVLEFIRRHSLQRQAAYFTETHDGETVYKLVYGSYPSKDKATFARQNLSVALKAHGPWLRTWSSVQNITAP